MGENIYAVNQIIKELSDLIKKNQFKKFIQTTKRAQNITKNVSLTGDVNKKLLKEKAEKELYQVYMKTKKSFEDFVKEQQFKKALNSYQDLAKPIEEFFNDVLVMSEDKKLQKNRLTLLWHISQLSNQLFTTSDLVGK